MSLRGLCQACPEVLDLKEAISHNCMMEAETLLFSIDPVLQVPCGAVISTQEVPYLSGPGCWYSRPLLQSRQRQLRQIYLLSC